MSKKDKLVSVRVPWEVWKALDLLRADRTVRTNKNHTLSDILREAIDKQLGDRCQTKTDH